MNALADAVSVGVLLLITGLLAWWAARLVAYRRETLKLRRELAVGLLKSERVERTRRVRAI